MREILFRGKRIDNGKWVQGFLVIWGNDYYIAPDINAYTSMGGRGKGRCMMFGHYYQVLPETVGQYTGLTDKNGKKIFEGDILKEYGSAPEHSLMVIKNTGFGCFVEFYFHGEIHSTEQVGHTGWLSYDEVIGNVHDNLKLLEAKK